jgi:ribosomal protein S18 acetylase RimI-like enzyme
MNPYPGRVSGIPLSRVVPREFAVLERALVPMGGEGSLYDGGHLAVVREAGKGDLAGLVELHRLAGEDLSCLDARLAPEARDAGGLKRTLRNILRSSSVTALVSEDGHERRLAGCAIGVVVKNEPFVVSQQGYLGCLYVRAGHRGSGVGDALLLATCERFKRQGMSVVQTDVSARDAASRGFWRAKGFEPFLDHLRFDIARGVVNPPDVPAVVVRKANSADTEDVIRLWKEMMDFHAPVDRRLTVGPGWRNYLSQTALRWLRDRDTALLVADAGGGVVGFALGSVVDVVLGLRASTHGHVAHLCTTGEWRRRGVGRLLFSSLRSWFVRRGMSSIHAYVSHYSPVSQRFWRALGFGEYVERLSCELA